MSDQGDVFLPKKKRVVRVTMNMAKYGNQRSQQPQNVHFETIIRKLKSDIFD